MKTSEVLRVAKQCVGTTYLNSYRPGMERFICLAIDSAANTKQIPRWHADKVAAIVQGRLAPHITLEDWLMANGVFLEEHHLDRVQQHRHAWLDMMIAEFAALGD